MKHVNYTVLFGVAAIAMTSACAPQPTPTPIYAEPVFNKFGAPSCRPVNQPINSLFSADLPLCPVIGETAATGVVVPQAIDGDGGENGGDVPPGNGDTPPDDDAGGNENQNQNQNQNQNENQNQNQNTQGSGG